MGRTASFEYKGAVRTAEADDVEQARRLRAQDQGAFEDAYAEYSSAAYGVALRVLRQDAIAQEVVHDAFLALWRAPEAFDPAKGSLRTFLLSLTHHRAVDAVRREERMRARNERSVNLDRPRSEDPADNVVESDWLDYRRKEVRAALDILPPDQRTVLEMAYFGGSTQVQIAEELGIPLGTVKTRTLAAMRKLRAALSTEES